jgi:uncharacterized repeat protein (TIGR02543 family)
MKKGLMIGIALFAMLAMMMSCDDGSGGGTTEYTVKYTRGDVPSTVTLTIPAEFKIKAGEKLTNAQLAQPAGTYAGFDWDGWYDGSTKWTSAMSVNKNLTLAANYTPIAVADDEWLVQFDLAGGVGNFPGITIKKDVASSGLGDKFPSAEPTKDGFDFGGWYLADAKYIATTAITASITLTAKWTEAVDKTVVEKIALQNGFYAVYRFDLPAGRVWEDYSGLTVDYKIDDAARLTLAGSSRAMRLMGPYAGADDFTFIILNNGSGKRMAVADYTEGKNAQYIFDELSSEQSGTIKTVAEAQAGVGTVTAGAWFTLPYKLDGTRANGSFANQPDDDATGPFYFGVGWTGNTSVGPTIHEVKNVTLLGYQGIANLVGYPAIFEDQEGNLYPAYTGYPDTGGNNGSQQASRKTIKGEFDTIEVTLTTIPTSAATCGCGGNEDECVCNMDGWDYWNVCECDTCGPVVAQVPTGPVTITMIDPEVAIVETHGSNLTVTVDGKVWSAMGNSTWLQANGSTNGNATLVTYKFPATVTGFIFEKVVITYDVRPWGDTEDPPEEGIDGKIDGDEYDYAIIVKSGYDSWSSDVAYPTISDDKSAKTDATLTYALIANTNTTGLDVVGGVGFSIQANVSEDDSHAEGYLFRITKLEFTCAEYADE